MLDDLQTEVRRSAKVKAAAAQFVRRFVGANDIVSVIHTGSGARAGQEFTSSQARILAAIDKFQGQRLQAATLTKLESYRDTKGQDVRDTLEAERSHKARSSLSTLEAAAEFLGNIRGRRKAVVWFGEGIDYDIEHVFEAASSTVIREDMRATIDTATRAGVSFYGVDARGVGSGLDQIIDIPGLPNDTSVDFGPGPLLDEVRRSQDFLRTISAETGGFAIVNETDLNAAFARIIQENSSYYLLGYHPTNDRRDGKFRRVEVRVKRPGLKIRWREGYTAPKGRTPSTPEISAKTGASPAVRAALDSPVPVSGLGLRVFAAPFAGPSSTILPRASPRSMSAWARRRLNALIGPKCWPSVVFNTPASTRRATASSSAPCASTSAVPNIGLVNMNSQCVDTLLRLNGEMSTTPGSSMSAHRPCGAMSSAIAAR